MTELTSKQQSNKQIVTKLLAPIKDSVLLTGLTLSAGNITELLRS